MYLYDELEAATVALLGFGMAPSRNPFLQVEIWSSFFERLTFAPSYFPRSNVSDQVHQLFSASLSNALKSLWSSYVQWFFLRNIIDKLFGISNMVFSLFC